MIDLMDIEIARLVRELRDVVQNLSLISHAPIQGYNFAPSEVGRGERWRYRNTRAPIPHMGSHQPKSGDTAIPRGKVDRKGDLTPEYRQKSADYFQYTLNRWERSKHSYTATDLAGLLKEAQDALEAWRKTHRPEGQEPEYGTPQWKAYIGASTESVGSLARRFNVTGAYIREIQGKYGTVESKKAREARDPRKKAA